MSRRECHGGNVTAEGCAADFTMPAARAQLVLVFSCCRCLLLVFVGVVEATSLEIDGDRGIHLMDFLGLALRALRQRISGDGTLNGEVITAILATIMVSGHCTSFADEHNDGECAMHAPFMRSPA